jgi:PAS domain S-box-containing protein
LDAIAEAVTVLDGDGRILEANARAVALLGRPLDQLIGSVPRAYLDPVHVDGSPLLPGETPTQRVLRTGEAVRDVVVGIPLRDGQRRWLSVSSQQITQHPDRDVAVVSTFVDVTEREELIRELSAPTLRVHEQMLVMPLIGRLDAARVRRLTSKLLDEIGATRARVAILDLTGVPALDTDMATLLTEAIEAAGMMGTRAIVTGLSAKAAAALADLAFNCTTLGDLQAAIQEGHRILGHRAPRPTLRPHPFAGRASRR